MAVHSRVSADHAHGGRDGFGHGLVGIHERIKLYGGQMNAGAANGRGFILRTVGRYRRDDRHAGGSAGP